MKNSITALLVAAFLQLSTEAPRPVEAQAQTSLVVLVMACLIGAGGFLIYAYARNDSQYRMRTLVLEKSHYDGNWTAIETNRVLVGPVLSKAFPAFYAAMTDDTACYRLREIAPPNPQFVGTSSVPPPYCWKTYEQTK